MRGSAAAVVAAAALLAGCGTSGTGATRPTPSAGATAQAATTSPSPAPASTADGVPRGDAVAPAAKGVFNPRALYARVAPGVVTIYSIFSSGPLGSQSGEGSGFVLNTRGEIATNAHVVFDEASRRRAREVYVEFGDRNRVRAQIVGTDPFADVAMLRVDPKGLVLRPVTLGTSADVAVGEPVAAIGSPFGKTRSLSVGVVSATDRSIQSLTAFQISGGIQTDAAINPGNSGGPLVRTDGSVVGINQQIQSNSGSGSGVGFAVPIDFVKHSLDQLRTSGKVRYAYLGLSSIEVFPQLAARFHLPVDHGAWAQTVEPGGPADRAGIHAGGRPQPFQIEQVRPDGDVITRVAGQTVLTPEDVARAVAGRRPGDAVDVQYFRAGKARTVRVRLGERPLGRPNPRG